MGNGDHPEENEFDDARTRLGPKSSASVLARRSGGMPVVPSDGAWNPDAKTSILPESVDTPSGAELADGSKVGPRARKPLELHQDQQIGRFGLIRELARGGMGQVFLARDTQLGRKVAIKFLLHDDPNFVKRFVIEARATARCTHENIVTIFEVGEHEGLPFMVLEYLEGKTLNDALAQKPSVQPFTELMVAVARALERAHEHGIVHRDLKPSNIFITDRGVVKVLDFGVAKCFDHETDALDKVLASSGQKLPLRPPIKNTYATFSGGNTIVGTVPYMSPEQWGAGEVDHQSDLWALGILFWRGLEKVHPAGTLKPEGLREKLCDLETPLPSLGSRDPEIPPALVAIVDRCLAKKKAERYQSATEILVDLQAFLHGSERISEDVCPYRGLAAFGERDAKYFFGRAPEIRTAMQQLETWPLLAVIGPSGVGKSSFVHAGLVPAMRDTGGNWQVRVLRPGRLPLQSLASVVDGKLDEGYTAVQMAAAEIGAAPGLFGDMLRKAARLGKHKVVIVVDQLEELFTLSDDDEVRASFLAALLAAADDPSAPVRVVLSMRADFLDRLAHHKQFLAELSRGLFFLSAPDRDNLRDTLVRPAELAGYSFESSEIVEDMLEAATLPLLQFAATRLWSGRDTRAKKLTAAAYGAMGGVGGAFARHADEVAAAVPSGSQLLLKAILTRLVTPEGTRAVVDKAELDELGDDKPETHRILDQLVRARLVNVAVDQARGTTNVEIIHEVLITEWPLLRRWLDESQALRGFMHELRGAVRQWVARDRPVDLLWSGAMATEAVAQMGKNVLDLSAAERDFLGAVREQASRKRRRKALVIATIFSVLGLVIAGGSVAVWQISRAQHEATAQAIAAESEAQKARAAETVAAKRLSDLTAESAKRTTAEVAATKAEVVAQKANADVAQSREELERTNEDLNKALAQSQLDQKKAQDLAAKANTLAAAAKTAADVAKKATEEAKVANANLQTLLAKEREHVKKLELEKSKIATGLQ